MSQQGERKRAVAIAKAEARAAKAEARAVAARKAASLAAALDTPAGDDYSPTGAAYGAAARAIVAWTAAPEMVLTQKQAAKRAKKALAILAGASAGRSYFKAPPLSGKQPARKGTPTSEATTAASASNVAEATAVASADEATVTVADSVPNAALSSPSSPSSAVVTLLLCGACSVSKLRAAFSNTQLNTKAKPRCTVCCDASVPVYRDINPAWPLTRVSGVPHAPDDKTHIVLVLDKSSSMSLPDARDGNMLTSR